MKMVNIETYFSRLTVNQNRSHVIVWSVGFCDTTTFPLANANRKATRRTTAIATNSFPALSLARLELQFFSTSLTRAACNATRHDKLRLIASEHCLHSSYTSSVNINTEISGPFCLLYEFVFIVSA